MIFKNISRYDHPNIIAGQGTMGLEIIEQVPDVDAVVIPVGGGGLIAGCAVALKTMNPNIKIIVRIKNSSYKKKNLIFLTRNEICITQPLCLGQVWKQGQDKPVCPT